MQVLKARDERMMDLEYNNEILQKDIEKWRGDFEARGGEVESALAKLQAYKDQMKEVERVRRLEHIAHMDMKNRLKEAKIHLRPKADGRRARRRAGRR